jgi:hypothetical protein
VVSMNTSVFWVVTPFSYRTVQHFFIGLLFDPEDGGNMFLRNVGLRRNYTVLQSRRLNFMLTNVLF